MRLNADEIEMIYNDYKNSINMSYEELCVWDNNQCSKLDSLKADSIKRNLHLLQTPKEKWSIKEITWARKMITFIKKHKKQPMGMIISDVCPYSRNHIVLANHGYWNDKK